MTLATNTLINTSYGIKMEEAIQTAAEELGYSNLQVKQKEAIMHYGNFGIQLTFQLLFI